MNHNSFSRKPLALFFPFDLLSHYLRSLELAKRLAGRFEIKFLYSAGYHRFVEDHGFSCVPGLNFDAQSVLAHTRQFSFGWLREETIRTLIADHRRILREFRPAVVFSDTLPTVKMAAQAEGIPHVSLINGYMSRYFALERPVPSIHPANRFRGMVPESFFNRMARLAEAKAFREIHQPFATIRRELHLPPAQDYLEELEGDLTLIVDLTDLFPQKDLPDSHRILGPLIYRSRDSETELRQRLENGKPTLLVTTGSSGSEDAFHLVREGSFRRYNIIVTGSTGNWGKAAHIFHQPFLNIPAVIDRVDVVLTHGGNGSIYQALAGGVPILCHPVIFEQEWNVQRVVELGVGEWLPATISKDDLLCRIEHWLRATRMGVLQEIGRKIRRSQEQISLIIGNLHNFAHPAPQE